MIFICHHLHEELKTKYLTVKSFTNLCNNLRERYKHQKTVILLKACYDWMDLSLQVILKVLVNIILHFLKSSHN